MVCLLKLLLQKRILFLQHRNNLVLFHTTNVQKKDEITKCFYNYFILKILNNRQLSAYCIAYIQSAAISYRLKRNSAHNGRKRLVRHNTCLLARIKIVYFKGSPFKTLLIQCKPICIPTQKFDLLPVLSEKDKDCSA